ncbi:phage tail assembly chaperone [Bradyrhizobium sp. 174]|uniref:phage tail assembly chaperone n=1 Tax=Bradyrhizobium sp. 174 TaxID=2782645 RepID=UPI001FF878F1|nr:phage tail assembly chaperone [Bradyrhizobium sp. 174]
MLDEMRAIDARTQRVDPVARAIIDKAEPDPEPDALPLVRDAVRAELAASDKFMMPDYPISEADRAAWARYRKALRDASKGNDTAAAMLAAIPARPDGSTLTLSPEVTT